MFNRLGLDELRTNNYTPSEAIFSGLYAYHVSTNTWTKLRDDCSGNSTGPQDIKSRIGHSMLFHSVSFFLHINVCKSLVDLVLFFLFYCSDECSSCEYKSSNLQLCSSVEVEG